MADDAQKPAEGGEEKSQVFQTGMGSFDRAGFNGLLSLGSSLPIKDEDIEKSKAADRVYSEASRYYNNKYEAAIKKIDPAYDPTSVEAQTSELTYNSNLRKIKKDIDEGKSLEGVKDILPLAEESAENRVSLTKELKTGTTTQIAEKINIRKIKEMASFDEVSEDFNKATNDEKLTLEKSLTKISGILSYFNDEIRDVNVAAKLFTPQNNAIISAIARILEKEGFSSDIVKTMSKKFEENLAKFAEKGESKIDGVMPTPGTTGAATGAATETTVSISPQKVEEKIEAKGATGAAGATGTTPSTEIQKLGEKTEDKKAEGTMGAVVATTPQKVEDKSGDKKSVDGSKEPVTPKDTGTKSEPSKNNTGVDFVKSLGFGLSSDDKGKKQTTESGKQELSSKETKGIEGTKEGTKKEEENVSSTTEKGEQKIETTKSENSGVDFIKSMFGGLIDEKKVSLESTKEDLKKNVTKGAESKMESTKAQVSEKIQKKAETVPGGGAIKETTSQKLATPSVDTSTKAENATAGVESSEFTTSTTSQEATTASSATGGATEEAKGAASENKGEGEGGGGLESKMDSMIGLLSQLNATLQGPLLTISSSKKFD